MALQEMNENIVFKPHAHTHTHTHRSDPAFLIQSSQVAGWLVARIGGHFPEGQFSLCICHLYKYCERLPAANIHRSHVHEFWTGATCVDYQQLWNIRGRDVELPHHLRENLPCKLPSPERIRPGGEEAFNVGIGHSYLALAVNPVMWSLYSENDKYFRFGRWLELLVQHIEPFFSPLPLKVTRCGGYIWHVHLSFHSPQNASIGTCYRLEKRAWTSCNYSKNPIGNNAKSFP